VQNSATLGALNALLTLSAWPAAHLCLPRIVNFFPFPPYFSPCLAIP
jgi:hypothetical protein